MPLCRCIQILLLVLEVHLGQADPEYQQVKKKAILNATWK